MIDENERPASKIPFPSLVGQTVIVKQAVLLALNHRAAKPSQDFHPSGIFLALLLITVAGPRRHYTGLPY